MQRRGRWLGEVWASTIGKKIVAAVSGVILALYVIVHALGNLKALQGDGGGSTAPVDTYSEWLRTVGEPAIPREGALWAVRGVLVVALILHVTAVIELWRRNRTARPPGARHATVLERSLASRFMTVGGLLIGAFVVFHVLHLTTHTIHPTPLAEGTVYANLYGAFSEWWISLLYVVAVIVVGLHLAHALWSVTQTAGYDRPNRNATFRRAAGFSAIAVTVAFAAVPIAFWAGILPDPSPADALATRGR